MTVDLTKLTSHTAFQAFKNNNIYTGSFVIGGGYVGGVNQRTFNILLPVAPDMADILFSAAVMEFEPNPATGAPLPPASSFIPAGAVDVPATGGTISSILFMVASELVGQTLTFRCYGVNQVAESGLLVNTTVNWRLVDYSVF